MKEAYSSGEDYDYYHIVSAEDYWSCPPCDFEKRICAPFSYIRCNQLPRPGWYKGGYELIQYKQLCAYGDIRKGLFGVINRLFKWFQIICHIRQALPDYPLFCGLVYSSLHKSAVHEIMHNPVADDFMSRLNNTLIPEEFYFQTVLMNSAVKDQIVSNALRYSDWSTVPGPKCLTIEDLDNVLNSEALFCRIVSDIKLAEALDARLGLI